MACGKPMRVAARRLVVCKQKQGANIGKREAQVARTANEREPRRCLVGPDGVEWAPGATAPGGARNLL